jgi:Tol biopolymer transport system component
MVTNKMITGKSISYLAIFVTLFLGVCNLQAVQTATNGIYEVSIDDTSAIGVFTVSTGANHPNPGDNVLYGGAYQSPGTSYLTVYSYTSDTLYVSTNSGPNVPSGNSLQPMSPYGSVSSVTGGFSTTWNIGNPDSLRVVQETILHGTRLEDSYVAVSTTVTNTGSSPVSIGLRYMWDWMIDGSDDSWFATRDPDGGWSNVFSTFSDPQFSFYEEVNDPASPLFSVFGTVNGPDINPLPTQPDLFSYVSWGSAYSNAWNFSVSGSGMDSAVCYFWGYPEASAIVLEPGESYTVSESLGTVSFSEIESVSTYTGRLLYVKDVERGEDGEVISTGNLYIRNLETGEETQLTDYEGLEAILNPAFTGSGDEVVFTAKSGVDYFRIFKISTEYVHTDVDVNCSDILEEFEDTDLKYAALSPDGNSLVYTKEKDATTTQLWVKDMLDPDFIQERLLINQNNLKIKHPVFMDNESLVYIGIVNGIQDIYILEVDGFSLPVRLTNNISPSPRYGRLQTSSRADESHQNMLIYSKSVYIQHDYIWSDWDVELGVISGFSFTVYPVTDTTEIEEFAPAFFGSSLTIPPPERSGLLVYSANITDPSDPDEQNIWQTGYDINGVSNATQRMKNRSSPVDLPVWGPVPQDVLPTPVPIGDTRLIYIDENGRVVSQDFNEDGSLLDPYVLTDATNQGENPSISDNGGCVVHNIKSPRSVCCMSYKGNDLKELVEDAQQPDVSADGRWAIYVRDGGLYAKLCTSDSSDPEVPLLTGINPLTGADYWVVDPSFSPDMNRIVFRGGPAGTNGDIYTLGVFFSENGMEIHTGMLQRVTDDVDYDDKQPSFSPDGSKIIFVSDRDDVPYAIYTMSSNGSNIRRLRAGGQADTQDVCYPVYTPMNDGSYAWTATSGSERHIYRSDTGDTGIVVKGDSEKFAWGIRREEGSIIGIRRNLPERIAKNTTFTYSIVIDVDEEKKPNSYLLEEVLPVESSAGAGDGWQVISVLVDGNPAEYDIIEGIDENGNPVQKIQMVFWNGMNGGVADHFVKITVLVGTNCSGIKSPEGVILYRIDGYERETDIRGSGAVKIANSYMPIDIYNRKGEIETLELLYAIDCWAENIQIEGVISSLWPVDTNNWDFIILKVIDIWVTGTGGYQYDGGTPADEMYWSPGVWSD